MSKKEATISILLFSALLILNEKGSEAASETFPIPSFDSRFYYGGRWIRNETTSHGVAARADWPCSSIEFVLEWDCAIPENLEEVINREKSQEENSLLEGGAERRTSYIELSMFNLRTRMAVKITPMQKSSLQTNLEQYIEGPSYSISPPGSDIYDAPQKVKIELPNECIAAGPTLKNRYLIALVKLSEAEPFAPGIGNTLLRPSVVNFYGISDASSGIRIIAKNEGFHSQKVHLEFVGASDTAGYCVDGTPDIGMVDGFLNGWKYGNCDYGFPGRITNLLEQDSHNQNTTKTIDYSYSVIAIAGIGLLQNANHAFEWIMGPGTMLDYYNKKLLSEPESFITTGSEEDPVLTIVSLGGNDYNHQNGDVPTQEEFSQGMANFLMEKVWIDPNSVMFKRVLLICGMGWPQEVDVDPDNNRCRPCPYVQKAALDWNAKHPDMKVGYQFIPCDGSVVPNLNGTQDMGCLDHKNRLGQMHVAEFLKPRIEEEIQIFLGGT